MKHPVELITKLPNNKLVANPKAVDILRKSEKPFVIVAIAGDSRTGKSFLANYLIDNLGGFPLGSSVEAETKGIWMWLDDHPKDATKSLLILDTEGLNHVSGTSDVDIWIFILSILLSTVFVYNQNGVIDANSVHGLKLACDLTDHVKSKTSSDEGDIVELTKGFPALVITIRDFMLDLTINGNPVTEDEYLEDCLSQNSAKKLTSRKARDFSLLKTTLRQFFSSRKCFTFPRPVQDDTIMKQLDQVEKDDLSPGFLAKAEKFKDHVLSITKVKELNGKEIGGETLAELVLIYLEYIEQGEICIENAHDYVIKHTNEIALNEALHAMTEKFKCLELPMSLENANLMVKEITTSATDDFVSKAISPDQCKNLMEQLFKAINTASASFLKTNFEQSYELCSKRLRALYKELQDKLTKDSSPYFQMGGFAVWKSDLGKMLQTYDEIGDELGPAKDVAKETIEKEIENVTVTILKNDESLKEAEKQRAKEEMEMNKVRVEKERLENELQNQKQAIANINESYVSSLEKMQSEMGKQQERAMEQLKADIEAKNLEVLRLQQEKMHEDAKLLQDEMSKIQKQMEIERQAYQEQQDKMRQEFHEVFVKVQDQNNQMIQQALNANQGQSLFSEIVEGVTNLVAPVTSLLKVFKKK